MTGLVAFVAIVAVYRLALLVTADEITRPPREWLLERLDLPAHLIVETTVDEATGIAGAARCRCGVSWVADGYDVSVLLDAEEHVQELRHERKRSRLAMLLDCPWCVSVWIGAPVAWSAWCFGDRAWWFVPALALTSSAGAGYLSQQASP